MFMFNVTEDFLDHTTHVHKSISPTKKAYIVSMAFNIIVMVLSLTLLITSLIRMLG